MPKIKSKKQARFLFAEAGRGGLPMAKVKKGVKKLGKGGFKGLPMKVKKKGKSYKRS